MARSMTSPPIEFEQIDYAHQQSQETEARHQ